MEPLSITASCVGLLASITTLSRNITNFATIARQACKDVDGFSRELSSLSLCVATLKDERFQFPATLQSQLLDVLTNCGTVIQDMAKIIDKHGAGRLGRHIQWSISDRDEVCRYRERLEAHKSVLEITLELASLTMANSIKEDTTEIRAEMVALRTQVIQLIQSGDSGVEPNHILDRYLNDSIAYADSVIDPFGSAFDDDDSISCQSEPRLVVPTSWQQNSQPSDPFPGYHRKTHKSQNSAVASSQQGYGSHFIDNALSIGSTQVRESLTADDRSRLDAELLVCLLDAADTRDAVYEFHLSKARDLIGLGAQIRDGHLDYEEINVHEFDRGLPMQGFFYHPRAQRGYRKEAPRIQYRELNFLLNHGHHVYEEGTAFLRYLLNIVSFGLYESQHERFILALLLSRADVNSFVTREMDKRVTVKKKFARQECRGTPDSYFGQTSLQIAAAKFRCYWLIPKLLEHGANYNQSDSQGRTSIDALIDSMRSDD